MDGQQLEELKQVRIANLKALIMRQYGNNAAALARDCERKPQYINDLVGDRKSFGEKAAMIIEDGARLLRGQMSIRNSQLLSDPKKEPRVPEDIQPLYSDLDDASKREAYEAILQIRARKKRRYRA
jgi:hypothetical protein